MHVCHLPRQRKPRVACEQASFERRGEEEKRKGREEERRGGGKGRKEKRKKLYGSQLSTCSAPLCKVKIPTNQLLRLHGSWSAKFCLSFFKMASCANKSMAVEIFIVEVTRSFSVFITVSLTE